MASRERAAISLGKAYGAWPSKVRTRSRVQRCAVVLHPEGWLSPSEDDGDLIGVAVGSHVMGKNGGDRTDPKAHSCFHSVVDIREKLDVVPWTTDEPNVLDHSDVDIPITL